MTEHEVEVLVEACRDNGDVVSCARLVRTYRRVAMHVAFGSLGNLQIAEEVVQELFLYAWQHLHQLKKPRAFAAWLRQIVRTQSLRVLRRRDLLTADDAEVSQAVEDPNREPENMIASQRFRSLLLRGDGGLSEPLRSAFFLYYLSGHPVAAVAEILGVRPVTVRKRLHDARESLRDLFSNDDLIEGRDELEASMSIHEENITARMAELLSATVAGDKDTVGNLLAYVPELARSRVQHPIWGGEPQPLHVAADRGQIDIVRQLLDAGADVNGDDAEYDGCSPLMPEAHGGRLGIHWCRQAIVEMLIEHGARLKIHEAVLLNDMQAAEQLLLADVSLANEVGPADAIPLHFVTSSAMVRLLLSHNAQVDARCGWHTNPLNERLPVAGRGLKAYTR